MAAPLLTKGKEMINENYDFNWWCEWHSWALPLKIAIAGDYTLFEIQVGPFGLTVYR